MSTKEILKQSIKDHQAVIDEAKKELSTVDELRHGDYGYGKNGYPCMEINHYPSGEIRDVSDLRMYDYNMRSSEDGAFKVKTKLGNIFDDLERNAKDLDEFKVNAFAVRSGFVAKITSGAVRIGTSYDVWSFDLNSATEIHQKLGQLLATWRRNEAKSNS